MLAGDGCLVLGSGANGRHLAPDWETLLDRMGADSRAWASPDAPGAAGRDQRVPIDARRDFAWTLGQLLRAAGRDVGLLRQRIYGGPATRPLAWNSPHTEQLRTAAAVAVAIACGPATPAGESPPATRPVVHPVCDVVTYNIDVFLEEMLAAAGFDVEGMTATHTEPWRAEPTARTARRAWARERGLGRRDPPTIRVFHPHGMLPRVARPGEPAAHDLVMTSEEYASYRFDPMSLPSLVELETYGARRCLFYGFSFLDARVRDVLQATVATRRLLSRRGPPRPDGSDDRLVPLDGCHAALFPAPATTSDAAAESARRLETWRALSLRQLGVVSVYGDGFPALRSFLRTCAVQLNRSGYPVPDDEATLPFGAA